MMKHNNISARRKYWLLILSVFVILGLTFKVALTELPIFIRWKWEELLSGIFIGAQWSILFACSTMLIASIIGISLGLISGYYQNINLKYSKLRVVLLLLTIFSCLFYGIYFNAVFSTFSVLNVGYTIILILSIYRIIWLIINKYHQPKRDTTIPIDSIISTIIEILNSIPKIIIVVVFSAVTQQHSTISLSLLIALTSWTNIARVMRAETLKCKEEFYIESAKALGLNNRSIIFKHILPNTIKPIVVLIVLGISSIILVESGLSFLGIGVPNDVITLGKIIGYGKNHIDRWEFIVLPSLVIVLITFGINQIAKEK